MTDPYAPLRDRVLAAWTASPSRFREDANAEEDAAYGALLPELAQNAADAAARAGVPGVLHVSVVDGVLYAANTGAPPDDAGVEALSHLRASAKSSGVGRYGVGFKTVLSVTDEPAIVWRGGGVRWSRAGTLAAVSGIAALAAEVERRGGAVPVMRLPYAATADAHAATLLASYDTVVVLPLRDAAPALDADPTLLLTLDLDTLTVGDTTLARDPSWRVHRASGDLPEGLLADRPVEERERTGWAVTVAVPAAEDVPLPWDGDRLLRAPQPTLERVDVPVFLSVSVPLEPNRRHVVPGALTDWLAGRAAESYVALLESLPSTPALLDLLPATLPGGAFDVALREALRWDEARLLPGARRGADAVVVDAGPASAAVTEVLAPLLDGVLDPAWLGGGRRRAALLSLGVRVLDTADAVEALHGLDRPPAWWAGTYAALSGVPDPDALRALPVPLFDGRLVTGPRGLLLPSDPGLVAATEAAGLPLRWVHPDAATGRAAEVLRSAGAAVAEPGALLDSLRDAVEASLDDEPPVDPESLAAVVLRLLASSPGTALGREWLGSLALPSSDGDLRAADELLLPGGRLVRWVRDDSPFGVLAASVVDTYGAEAVEAAGVLRTFAVLRDDDPYAAHDLDDEDAYDPPPGELVAVRDLEWVRDDAWPEALAELPVLEGYTLWWLRRHALLPTVDGALRPVRDLAAEDADPLLAALYDRPAPLPAGAANVVARLGLVTTVDAMDEDGLADLADRIAERASLDQARALYAALARRGVRLDPPRVRAVRSGALVTVPTGEAYAVDRPDLLPLLGERAWVPVDVGVAAALSDVLGLRLASSLDARVTSTPTGTTTVDGTTVDVHDDLAVNGVRVAWFAGAVPAVDGTPRGVARLTAWRRGDWPSRYAVEAALRGDAPDDETLLDP